MHPDEPTEIPDLFSVKGLVAVVTGGGTGIGLSIARVLERNGAIVYIASRRLDLLVSVAKEYGTHGNLIPVQCDVTSEESIQRLVDIVKERHGFINLLVNNAGLALNMLSTLSAVPKGDVKAYQAALLAGTRQEFGRSFDVNTTAVWYVTVQFLELLDAGNKQKNLEGVSSQVITISSGGGFRKDEKVFTMSYTLSKAATTHLGKMLAHFFRDWDIRSNVICPGVFHSEMMDPLINDAMLKVAVPMQRAGNIDDIGGIVLYLCSKAGAYVNGGVHLVDGGRLTLFPSTY